MTRNRHRQPELPSPARVITRPARVSGHDRPLPARVSARVGHQPEHVAAGEEPEPAFGATSRVRLVSLLLAEEARRLRKPHAAQGSQRAAPPPDSSEADDDPPQPGANMTADRPTLSVAETATLLGISRWLVEQAVHDGSLPSVRVGRRILIPRSRLLAWIDGQHDPGAASPGHQASHPEDRGLAVLPRRTHHTS